MKLVSDKYKTARGGRSQLLDILCVQCSEHILFYQKDGPGGLRRMYMDRILDPEEVRDNQYRDVKDIVALACPACSEIVAHPTLYKKEKRNAYRLFGDSVVKKKVNPKNLVE